MNALHECVRLLCYIAIKPARAYERNPLSCILDRDAALGTAWHKLGSTRCPLLVFAEHFAHLCYRPWLCFR